MCGGRVSREWASRRTKPQEGGAALTSETAQAYETAFLGCPDTKQQRRFFRNSVQFTIVVPVCRSIQLYVSVGLFQVAKPRQQNTSSTLSQTRSRKLILKRALATLQAQRARDDIYIYIYEKTDILLL